MFNQAEPDEPGIKIEIETHVIGRGRVIQDSYPITPLSNTVQSQISQILKHWTKNIQSEIM